MKTWKLSLFWLRFAYGIIKSMANATATQTVAVWIL